MKQLLISLLLIATGLSAGCDQEKIANRGFALPPGDTEQGQKVFIEKQCIACHTLAGAEFAGDEWNYNMKREINVTLGGEVTKLKTYGDLVTSVINPSHRIAKGYEEEDILDEQGKSKMRVYNDVMTVAELVDLVTFLQSQYELVLPPVMAYPHYVYPY